MGSITTANVNDVLKNRPRERVVHVGGERRTLKRPEGRCVEEFVDPSGNVVWIKLLGFGTPEGQEAIDRNRAQLRRDGFIEYSMCPLRTGASNLDELAEEFRSMPDAIERQCVEHPTVHEHRQRRVGGKVVGENHQHDSCPHVMWLVNSRRDVALAEAKARADRHVSTLDLEKQKLQIQQDQLDETREANRRMQETLERLAGSKKKGE